jgi:hypothetical protein
MNILVHQKHTQHKHNTEARELIIFRRCITILNADKRRFDDDLIADGASSPAVIATIAAWYRHELK